MKFLAATFADDCSHWAFMYDALNFIKFDVQAAMSFAGDALQILNLIIGLVAVNMVNFIALGNSSVMKLPNDPMKSGIRRLIPAALIASVVDAVKALVRVVDDFNFHDESLLQLKIARQARRFNKFYLETEEPRVGSEPPDLCSYKF